MRFDGFVLPSYFKRMTQSDLARRLLGFIKNSPTPFHAVKSITDLLQGFTKLEEGARWKLEAGGKYYVTRGDSSIVAFRMGTKAVVETGMRLVGAHTDSPGLHLRPVPEVADRHYLRLGVEIYGGVLLSTWFDRDLSLAGRVFYARKGGKGIGQALIDFERAIAVVPNLAIHLNRAANENRTIQKQVEVVPLIAHASAKAGFHEAVLEELGRVGVKDAERVVSHDLSFYDTQDPAVVGLHGDFLASARLDNLLSCFAGTAALIQAKAGPTQVLVCNDHEEVGSVSWQGAQGTFLRSVLERVAGSAEDFTRALSQSMLVSTDNAHGIHPAYPEKHESNHTPILNHGPAIKTNTNQRYSTSAETAAWIQECAGDAEVPLQSFVARNDMGCGSTIGPLTASVLGVRAVDLGVPTFAMHSAREMAGVHDVGHLASVLEAFYGSERT